MQSPPIKSYIRKPTKNLQGEGFMRRILGLSGLMLITSIQSAYAANSINELRVIIKYKDQNNQIEMLKQAINQSIKLPIKAMTAMAGTQYLITLNTETLTTTLTTEDARSKWVLSKLRENPAVLYAVKDRVGHFKPLPTIETKDDLINLSHEIQWDEFAAPAGVVLETAAGKLDGAWAYTMGESPKPIVVAVLDTGIALNNSLINSLVKDKNGDVWGWNFAANNRNLSDQTGSYHGTHVAGTIAGYGNVMSGIGPKLKVLPLKIPDASGMFYESQVINAMYWSVGEHVPGIPENPYPAKVLNMSFGIDIGPGQELDECDEALQETVNLVKRKGAVLAVAAGNDNLYERFKAPAVCQGTIRVAATGPEGLRAYYSNYGPGISFAAPGGDSQYGKQGAILSTVNPGGGYQGSGFDFYQGTSMASPHAAGIAGLIYAVSSGDISAEQVERILRTTTHDFGKTRDRNKSCVGNKPCGHGILDAHNAVVAALAGYDLLFSAPVMQKTNLVPCGTESSIAKTTLLQGGRLHWKLTTTACQANDLFNTPKIKQIGNQIIASYGSTSYQLDTSTFKECKVIGVDGVGCYF